MKRKCTIIILSLLFLTGIFINYNKSFAEYDDETHRIEQGYSQAYEEYLNLSEEERAKLSVIPRKYDIPLDSIYENTVKKKKNPQLSNLFGAINQYETVSVYADKIPSTYNLTNKIKIPVKNQGSYGLCAVFSCMRSVETNIALHEGINVDLSELHVDYITSKDLGLYNYDRKLHDDGVSTDWFMNYCADLYGPVYEIDVPYSKSYSKDDYEYLKNIENKVYVTETIDFPTIDKANKTYTDEELALFRNKVKKHIMENGSVYSIIWAGLIKNINGYNTLYNPGNGSNHAISIIGWDDNFSRENFRDSNGNKPQKDGAYIALNSWGSNDIIYISYETATIEREMIGVVNATTDINKVNRKSVQFSDKNLYQALKNDNNFNKRIISYNDNTQTISYLDIIKEEFDLSKKEISNIQGIENFEKLKVLKINNNNILDISMLGNKINLQELDISYNKIKDISKLTNLTNLNTLRLDGNSITDISTLTELRNLTFLSLGDCKQQINLNPLRNMKQLTYLELGYNNLEDISVLSDMTNLEYLFLSGNKIKDISALKKLTKLNYLILNFNKIADISPISNLTELRSLYLKKNEIDTVIEKYEASFAIELPEIIKECQDINSKVYSEDGLTFNNCTLGKDKKHITINDTCALTASVKVNAGQAQDTEFTVYIKTLTGIEVTKAPTNVNYIEGQNFDSSGMKVTAYYSDGSSKEIKDYKVMGRK